MRLFVSARENGVIVHSSPAVSISLFALGDYDVHFPQDVTNCVPVATLGEASNNGLAVGFIDARTEGTATPRAADNVEVATWDKTGGLNPLRFNLAVVC